MKFLARGLNANRRWLMKKALGVVGATTVGTRLLADSPKLGGIQDKEVAGGSGNPIYTAKLQNLDSDFPQYVHDNSDDEIIHFTFFNAYLTSNLAQLTLDTSWWTRYRSSANNPDLDANFVFPGFGRWAIYGNSQDRRGSNSGCPRSGHCQRSRIPHVDHRTR